MKKTLLLALLALLMPLVANAYDFESGGIYYNFNSDGTSVRVTCKTTSDGGYSGSVVIPSTVTYNDAEYSVTSIGDRGFWDGYYQGSTIMEYTANYGSLATEKKVYCGKVVRYFSKLGVAEFKIEACELNKGDEIMVTGPTTGCLRLTANEIRNDEGPVDTAKKGWCISISTEGTKVRRNDKLFVIRPSSTP